MAILKQMEEKGLLGTLRGQAVTDTREKEEMGTLRDAVSGAEHRGQPFAPYPSPRKVRSEKTGLAAVAAALLAATMVGTDAYGHEGDAPCVQRAFIGIDQSLIRVDDQEGSRWSGWYPPRFVHASEIVHVRSLSLTLQDGAEPTAGWLVLTRTNDRIYWTPTAPQLGRVCGPPAAAAPEPVAAALTAEQHDRAEAYRFQLIRALDALHPSDLR